MRNFFCSQSVGNSITFQDYPQRITLSIYPVNTMTRSIVLMLQRNKWYNIASLVDTDSILKEQFHRALISAFHDAFPRNDSRRGINYNEFRYSLSAGTAEIARTLHSISQGCRGKITAYVSYGNLIFYSVKLNWNVLISNFHIWIRILCQSSHGKKRLGHNKTKNNSG